MEEYAYSTTAALNITTGSTGWRLRIFLKASMVWISPWTYLSFAATPIHWHGSGCSRGLVQQSPVCDRVPNLCDPESLRPAHCPSTDESDHQPGRDGQSIRGGSRHGTVDVSMALNETQLDNGGRITGARSTNLTITGVETSNAGNYSVVVSNPYGAVTSAVVSLTVMSDDTDGTACRTPGNSPRIEPEFQPGCHDGSGSRWHDESSRVLRGHGCTKSEQRVAHWGNHDRRGWAVQITFPTPRSGTCAG